jgi:hypothetical protein
MAVTGGSCPYYFHIVVTGTGTTGCCSGRIQTKCYGCIVRSSVMYHFTAASPEGTIAFQNNGFCNGGGERTAKTVQSPFSDAGNTAICVGTCDRNRYPVVEGKDPLTGYLPAALGTIVKRNRHIAAGNGMGDGIQYVWVPFTVILLLSLVRVTLKF